MEIYLKVKPIQCKLKRKWRSL